MTRIANLAGFLLWASIVGPTAALLGVWCDWQNEREHRRWQAAHDAAGLRMVGGRSVRCRTSGQ